METTLSLQFKCKTYTEKHNTAQSSNGNEEIGLCFPRSLMDTSYNIETSVSVIIKFFSSL